VQKYSKARQATDDNIIQQKTNMIFVAVN